MSGSGGSYRGRGFGQRTRPSSNGYGGSRYPSNPNLKSQNRRGNNRPGGDDRGPNNNRQYQWRQNNRPNNQSYQKFSNQSTFKSAWDRTSSDYGRNSSNDRDRDRDRNRDRDRDRSRDRSDRSDRNNRPYQNYQGRGGYRGSNNRYSGPGRPGRHSSPYSSSSGSRSPSPKGPLPGSQEERQQKITETAAKLKKSLSAITEEEKAGFWEQDLAEATAIAASIGEIDEKPSSDPDEFTLQANPELRHNPSELKLTQDDFKDVGQRADGDSSNKVDFNQFTVTSKEITQNEHLVVDSVGNPEMDDFGVLQLKDHDESSAAHTENVQKSTETVAPLEEPIDFANVMQMLGNVSDDSSRDSDNYDSDPPNTRRKSSKKELSLKTFKSKHGTESGSSYYDPILSTSDNKSTPVVAMCPPPSSDFSTSNTKLGYTPALGTSWSTSLSGEDCYFFTFS